MIINGNKIFQDNGSFRKGAVRIKNGIITDVITEGVLLPEDEEEVVDAGDNMVIPGLVDIHFHGCDGVDFCDGKEESIKRIAIYQEKNGVTSIVPATMTLGRDTLRKIFEVAGKYDNQTGSVIRGINMEGPFVSMAKKGAQNGAYLHKPDVSFFNEMQELCGGMIKQVAIAPEEDYELTVVKQLSEKTVVSVAHTVASYDIANMAFLSGANHVTHLFNGMNGFTHREPGVIGAAFDNKHVYVELICDGIHIHPSMMRAVFNLFGCDRVCVISDSMMATGLSNGDYALGGQPVKVVGKLATLADGTIAGSASNLMDCVRVLINEAHIEKEKVFTAATLTPAKSLGIDSVCGSITPGKDGQLVILNDDLEILRVINERRAI